jgi:hypothetical protein
MKRLVILTLLLVISCTVLLAQGHDLPGVVARVKLTGQTQAIPPTLVFTPKSTGIA